MKGGLDMEKRIRRLEVAVVMLVLALDLRLIFVRRVLRQTQLGRSLCSFVALGEERL